MAITNFEEITQELTAKELELIPVLIAGFPKYKKANPIKAPKLIANLNSYIEKQNNFVVKLTGPRFRKCVNYIRSNGLLPLMATSRGYYVTEDKEEVEKCMKSLYQRAASIRGCADGLARFVL